MKTAVFSVNAPAPIGPYSQAIAAQGFLFVSGQIAIDPATGQIDSTLDVRAETHRVMQNLQAVLTAGGSTFDQVVKTSIFLTDMQYFSEVNEVYATYFSATPPARETVAVLGLPKGVRVEISVIALQ